MYLFPQIMLFFQKVGLTSTNVLVKNILYQFTVHKIINQVTIFIRFVTEVKISLKKAPSKKIPRKA